jgi:hypothetical protein
MTIGIWETQGEHLGHEFADLPGRKIDDRGHLAIEQIFLFIIFGTLRR